MNQPNIQLCPTCMKRFDGDMCVRCEREKMDWEKELAIAITTFAGNGMKVGELKQAVHTAIQQAIAQERERIESGHILSQDNGVVGGKIRFTGTRIPVQLVAEYEAKGHSLDEIINDIFPSLKDLHIITNNHEDHKE